MAKFTLHELENWNEPDVFVVDKNLSFNLDTTAHSIFKLQRFINTYGDFQNPAPSLNSKADRDFLGIMLKPKDVENFINVINKKFKAVHVPEIVHQMFSFWFKQATGQDLAEVEKAQEKKQ
ncbi:hypothetical protein NXS15_01205 [Mycoplasma sp. CSL7475-4]|uniref:hypothetical protein n=1 Tax=Mycoplasma sp. CSL7475-4 TaxID=2973942 RepID=UPI00216B5697|nr:hypothetical protein [Mycoplasma sp. CSL7475-4]MCS4536748.1 hypothetical protein [Mycoplasma sp. CSL7475-4]